MKQHILITCLATVFSIDAADAPPVFPGLADPGTLNTLSIQGDAKDKGITLSGRDARGQLVVSGHYSTGQQHDLTDQATYRTAPENILKVNARGGLLPLANGTATVTATAKGKSTSIQVTVLQMGTETAVHFDNEVTPILTKLGCNTGACHGKKGGKGGLELSLLGYGPEMDHQHLTRQGRIRRIMMEAPDLSPFLRKSTGDLPHVGGARLERDSPEYRTLRRWITEGARRGNAEAPKVASIEVFPKQRVMPRKGTQQLRVVAHYTDGTLEDVTRLAEYKTGAASLAEADETGLVKTRELIGDVAVMARYQGQVAPFRITIPMGVKVAQWPQPRNFVDVEVFRKWREVGIPPSKLCDDPTFIRRVTIDIAGRIPKPAEVSAFLADKQPGKRERLIERLLASSDYADYFANKWAAMLKVGRGYHPPAFRRGVYGFHAWIRRSLHQNKPYDQFVREILAASGPIKLNPNVAWFRSPDAQLYRKNHLLMEDASQIFLGTRMQCAQCHHHPFEKWSQDDYRSFLSFFTYTRTTPVEVPADEIGVVPLINAAVTARGLGDKPMTIPPGQDARSVMVDWMAKPDNPFFARALSNRYWKHFFSRGLVEPEDDLRDSNPPTNPGLLDALAEHFVKSKFDLKGLIREICRSHTYQLSALPNEYNKTDLQYYSRYYTRRLHAEVLLDAVDQVAGTHTVFKSAYSNTLPAGTRAVQLPAATWSHPFLNAFGRPQGKSACECERENSPTLTQALQLLNSNVINGKINQPNARPAQWAADTERSAKEKIAELYRLAYARAPTDSELTVATSYLERASEKPAPPKTNNSKPPPDPLHEAYVDLMWALITRPEFLFND